MKPLLALVFLAGLALVAFGLPGRGPLRAAVPGTPVAVLPMRFAHNDHFGVSCATCHHEFVDGTVGPPCLACHVTDLGVRPLLQDQFHQLCMSCHEEKSAAVIASGPVRHCTGCHQTDAAF